MLRARLRTAFVVGLCMAVIVCQRFMPFSNGRTYFVRPISNNFSEMDTTFSPRLFKSNCTLSGYILVLRYAGQQGGGVKSLVSLQRWVKNVGLPMMIVEPFIQDSFLGTYRKSFEELKFSDMFDLENFNRVSRSEEVTELIPWDTYVICAPIRAVLVRIKQTASPSSPKLVWNGGSSSNDIQCWQSSDEVYKIAINVRRLCYVRVVEYFHQLNNPSYVFSAREVHNVFLAGLELTKVTLVFDLWSMAWHNSSARPKHLSYFDNLSASYTKNGSVFLGHKLQDSPKLLQDVKNYQNQFLMTKPGLSYVAVMLRVEYIVMMQRHTRESINLTQLQALLDEAVNVTTMMMEELRVKDVLVTADVGLYGSVSWLGTLHPKYFHNGERERVEEQIKSTVEKLYKSKWTFEEWEKSFAQATGGVKDRGYIAALQRALASQASCLILVGGGAFQALTLRNYIGQTEPHQRCIRFVGMQSPPDVEKLYALKNV